MPIELAGDVASRASPTTTCGATFTDRDFDDDGWETDRRPRPLALDVRVRRRRRPAAATARASSTTAGPAASAGPGSRSTASSTKATSGSTAPTSATPRATSSPTRSRSPSRSPDAPEHMLAVEVACAPPDRPHGEAQPHRRVPALGLPRPGLEPRRHLATGAARDDRPGPHPRPARAVPRRDDRARRRRVPRRPRRRSRPAPVRVALVGRRRRPRARAVARRRREPGRVDGHHRPTRRSGGRGRSATSRCTTSWSRSWVDDELEPPALGAHRPAPDRRSTRLDLLGQRRAPLPQGREPGPDAHGARRGDARGARPRRRRSRTTPASTCSGSTRTSPGPSCTTRPTKRDCCSGRTCRCSGATRAACASRPSARPARPSTCSATTRRSRSGAGTTSRWPSTIEPGGEIGAGVGRRARSPRRCCRRGTRRSSTGRSSARSSRPTARRPVIAHSGVLPHLPQLDGTDSHLYFGWYWGDERDFPKLCASGAAAGPLRHRVRRAGRAGRRGVLRAGAVARPRLGPGSGTRHALQKRVLRPVRAAGRRSRRSTSGARRRSATRPTVVKHHVETLRRLKYRPTGGFAQFCFADGMPAVTWSRARPRPPAEARLRRARPGVPPGDRRRRPPARDQCAPGDALALDVHVVSDLRTELRRLHGDRDGSRGTEVTTSGRSAATSKPTAACGSARCRPSSPTPPDHSPSS